MAEAVFGLVGVVIGALVSGGVAFAIARRTEARKALASARLVQDELTAAHHELANPWPVLALDRVSQQRWVDHQGVLAEALDTQEWTYVARAYSQVEGLKNAALLGYPEGSPDSWGVLKEDAERAVEEATHLLSRRTGTAFLPVIK
jgi:hypothetical protein